MLEFFYDCISKYFIENSFELTETDTDSIYMAINEATIDECIRSSHHDIFQKEFLSRVGHLGPILDTVMGFFASFFMNFGRFEWERIAVFGSF